MGQGIGPGFEVLNFLRLVEVCHRPVRDKLMARQDNIYQLPKDLPIPFKGPPGREQVYDFSLLDELAKRQLIV
jgi:hypothetical protein